MVIVLSKKFVKKDILLSFDDGGRVELFDLLEIADALRFAGHEVVVLEESDNGLRDFDVDVWFHVYPNGDMIYFDIDTFDESCLMNEWTEIRFDDIIVFDSFVGVMLNGMLDVVGRNDVSKLRGMFNKFFGGNV